MGQLIAEDVRGLRRREVPLLVRPPMDRAHYTADQLLDAALPLGRAENPTEVLRDDHVGSHLRPGGRDLDLVLLEDDFTLFVGDGGLARFPLDLLERGYAGASKVPLPGKAVPVALRGAGGGRRGQVGSVGRRLLGGSGHREPPWVGWRAAHIVCRRMKAVKQFTTAGRVSRQLCLQHMAAAAQC